LTPPSSGDGGESPVPSKYRRSGPPAPAIGIRRGRPEKMIARAESPVLGPHRWFRKRGVESPQQGKTRMEIQSPNIFAIPERLAELDRLGDEIAVLSAHLDAATARLLDLIREFDERAGWANGFRSCAAWLSWRVGLDLGAAREKVRVAHALETLPRLALALANAELSVAASRVVGYRSARDITSSTGSKAAPPRSRTSPCSVAGIIVRFTRRASRSIDSPTARCGFGGRTAGPCPRSRHPSCPPILCKRSGRGTKCRACDSTHAQRVRVGWVSVWTWGGRSTSCIRWRSDDRQSPRRRHGTHCESTEGERLPT
jgi:hypothetical protein